MTALQLLACISAALLLQVAAVIGVIVWRRRGLVAQIPQIADSEVQASPAGVWSGWRRFRVTHRNFEDAAKSQCSFYLQPVDGEPLPAFRPGQYLTFSLQARDGLAGVADSERSLIRCYSLSDQPDSTAYRITIKRLRSPAGRPDLPPGVASSHFHDQVQAGNVLKVKAPAGHFFLDSDANVPAVFIAGGIGITPMMSMLRWCASAQPGRAVHLYYGVRNSADHAFRDVLHELAGSHRAFQLHVVYSCPGPDDVQGRDFQHVGHIDMALLRASLPHGQHQFYVCGPPSMMQSLVPALRQWGVKEDDIHFESFGPAGVRLAGPATTGPLAASSTSLEVQFSRTGRTLNWDGQDANLLDFAERHGVPVSSGCRAGSCGACETKVISGMVHYASAPDHDLAKGHCLLCVGKPLSALVLDL